jgi:hypothetical protein
METTPTTPAGAKALLDWLTLNLDRGDEWPIFRSREVFELLIACATRVTHSRRSKDRGTRGRLRPPFLLTRAQRSA